MAKKNTNKNMFRDAFVNDDKDYTKKVEVEYEGEKYEIAEIRFLTQFEISDIYQSISRKSIIDTKETDKISDNININEFVLHLAKESIVSWVFEKDITIDNIKYLKEIWKTPIMEAINELREYWEKKDK